MKVYLLYEGDGSDGDEMQVIAVYADQSVARARAESECRKEYPHFVPSASDLDEWGRWSVEEFEVE